MAVTSGLVEDDTLLHPEVDSDTLLYIQCLDENVETYTRFFDALLIKRNQHRAFFRDLRAFRQQPRVIVNWRDALQDRKLYRDLTNLFLDSRYAHPWCRKTPLKQAFWRSEWGSIDGKRRDSDVVQEEDRLHRLLVPVWIVMRFRMFPGETIVTEFCVRERERRSHALTHDALARQQQQLAQQAHRRYSTDDDLISARDVHGLTPEEERIAAGQMVTSIVRLAAAGAILSQQPKRKLRWLLKKPK